ncbi:hypothetical protein [uncultured Gammaproteobacteria bacterium]|nr:hypothetical protein [Bathymodiolus heckerae thiotrophic gill symbiont]CAC9546951.1 hypothetical protein [uncultured Gammaproteobacteria bacterium]CAC9581778.1 hypothetical protein [uncultured Gammaproteobacteria bacterium]CAC9606403.1 hypothetical protein [uncultured Gammaproteobacteria bacterium]CAC9962008.1 hypothetical protein [uncultured Gammaproteobacteria bacterium]SHN91589.1 hypothetical protein BHECKSOX_1921 [Bathymodiolus heckerae thiotrophic gill symbiont]
MMKKSRMIDVDFKSANGQEFDVFLHTFIKIHKKLTPIVKNKLC